MINRQSTSLRQLVMLQNLTDISIALLWVSLFLAIPCNQEWPMYAKPAIIVYGLPLMVILAIVAFEVRQQPELSTPGFLLILAPSLLFYSGLGRIRKPYLLLWILFWIAGVLLIGIIGFAFYANEAATPIFTQGIIFVSTGVSALFAIILTNYQFQKIEIQPVSLIQVILSFWVLGLVLLVEKASEVYMIFALVAQAGIMGMFRWRKQLWAHHPALITTILLSPGFLMQNTPYQAIFISLLCLAGVIWLTIRKLPSYFDPAWITFFATAVSGYLTSLVYIIQVLKFDLWILFIVLHAQIFAALVFNFLFLALFQLMTDVREKPIR